VIVWENFILWLLTAFNSTIFQDVTTRSPVVHRRFGRRYCFHLHSKPSKKPTRIRRKAGWYFGRTYCLHLQGGRESQASGNVHRLLSYHAAVLFKIRIAFLVMTPRSLVGDYKCIISILKMTTVCCSETAGWALPRPFLYLQYFFPTKKMVPTWKTTMVHYPENHNIKQ
jgi:hypothetical protein